MATVPYNPGEVFVVHAPQGQTMTVILSAEETSVDVFGTDKFMLKGKNIGNTIVFWTSEELLPHRTVIIVGRTAEGKQRTYTLLVDSMSPEFAHLSLRFTYPEDERAKQAALWRVAAAKKAEAAVLEKVDAKPDCTNFAYQLQGKTTADFNLLPTREVCDDGVHTYFWFPGTMKMPVIYDGAGKETVVDPTFNARTGIAVVHQLSTQWHIRDDDNLLCVFNKAPDPVGRTVFR